MTSAWTCALAAFAVSSLVACASTQTGRVATVPPTAAAPTTSKAAPKAGDAVPVRYRVVKKGDQELYCRRDLLTGSRTKAMETCLTKAQLDAERAGTEDYLRRIQSTPVETGGGSDASGGRSNGVLSQ